MSDAQYCMIVMRKLRCGNSDGATFYVDVPVAVYGPFTEAEACARADQFRDAYRETEDEKPYYRPVAEAPAFLDQENWPEHRAIVRPMNDDVTW